MKVKPEVFVFFAYNKRQTLTPFFIYLFIYFLSFRSFAHVAGYRYHHIDQNTKR